MVTLAADTALTVKATEHLHEGVTDTTATFFVNVGGTKYWLQATGVSVKAPKPCTAPTTVTTTEITAHADWMHEGKAYEISEAIHKTTGSTLNVSSSTAVLDGAAPATIGGAEFGVKCSSAAEPHGQS